MPEDEYPLNDHVWLTRREAAVYARVSIATIDRLLRTGRLKRYRAGKRVRIRRTDVDKWLLSSATVLVLAWLFMCVASALGVDAALDLWPTV